MFCKLKMRWLWAGLPFCLVAGLAGAAAPTEGTARSPTLDNWQSYLQSPMIPSRSHMYEGDDGNAVFPKSGPTDSDPPTTPIAITTKPTGSRAPLALKPKPGSDDDRLAEIALEDRDFFQTLAKNPKTWPEDERDRRAQQLHDKYWLYVAEYPDDVSAIILYGKLLNRTGQRDAAFTAFEHADTMNPKIAVVKQQLANRLAEDGHYATALEMFHKATAIAPYEAIYHYETAELLDFFYEGFLKDKIFTRAALNKTMEAEFARAMELAPQTPAFAWRHAECYYDMFDPDWKAALGAWDELAATMKDALEIEVIRLHQVRILIELARFDEARKLLDQPVRDSLEPLRGALGRRLAAAVAATTKNAPPAATAPTIIPTAAPTEPPPTIVPKAGT